MDAGWYDDPQDGSHYRYWDGTAWTGHRSPKAPGPAAPPGPPGPVVEPPTVGPVPTTGGTAGVEGEPDRVVKTGPTLSRRHAVIAGSVVAALLAVAVIVRLPPVARVLNPPPTREELCKSYGEFATRWFSLSERQNFDSTAFRRMRDLSKVAKRYDNDRVKADGKALDRLQDGDDKLIVSVSLGQAAGASANIARECGQRSGTVPVSRPATTSRPATSRTRPTTAADVGD